MPSDAQSDAALPVLLMRVSGQTLAIRQREVVEILPLPRLVFVPEAPPVVIGAFHLAGEAVLVLRLADLLGISAQAEGDPLYHHLLMLPDQPGRPRLALLVDRATDIRAADRTPLAASESFNGCVEGSLRLDGWPVPVPLLAVDRLLTAHEEGRIAAFAGRAAARDVGFEMPGLGP